MKQPKYDSSTDLIKIIACFLVVAIHTLSANLGVLNFIVVQISLVSIPLFFIVNGYLLFRKEKITYNYVFRKIMNILKVCFMWEVMHAVAHYLYYGEVRDFLRSFVLDFIQKGLFYHFWFLGALILIYLVLPYLHMIYKKTPIVFVNIVLVLGVLCVGIHVGQLIVKERYILKIIQTFRLWIWLFYYMLGGLIYSKKEFINKILIKMKSSTRFIVSILACMYLMVWQYFMGICFFGNGYMNEAYYGAFVTIITTSIIFGILSQLEIDFKYEKYIKTIARTTMGIYIVHPFILAVIEKFFPIVRVSEYANIMFWGSTCMISMIISFIIGKIPMLKNMIKL